MSNMCLEFLTTCLNSTETSKVNGEDEAVLWIVLDSLLFIVIVLGNILTILAISWARRLRSIVSNYFILNLAVSDLLVGVTLPFHLAIFMNSKLNQNKPLCISRFVIINLACGGSIYNIMMIAVDRYIAVVHPLTYNVHVTKRRVLLIIVIAWTCTIGISSIPIYSNCFDVSQRCEYETILPGYYIVAIQMPSFFICWIAISLLYWKIWREAHMNARRMNLAVASNVAEKHDRKGIQVLMLILGCFSVCWLPYYIVACSMTLGCKMDWLLRFNKYTYTLATVNSGMNPFIYAWKNANFRKAFQKILHLKSPNGDMNLSFKMYLEKQHELNHQQMENDHNANGNSSSHGCSSDCLESSHAEENRAQNSL